MAILVGFCLKLHSRCRYLTAVGEGGSLNCTPWNSLGNLELALFVTGLTEEVETESSELTDLHAEDTEDDEEGAADKDDVTDGTQRGQERLHHELQPRGARDDAQRTQRPEKYVKNDAQRLEIHMSEKLRSTSWKYVRKMTLNASWELRNECHKNHSEGPVCKCVIMTSEMTHKARNARRRRTDASLVRAMNTIRTPVRRGMHWPEHHQNSSEKGMHWPEHHQNSSEKDMHWPEHHQNSSEKGYALTWVPSELQWEGVRTDLSSLKTLRMPNILGLLEAVRAMNRSTRAMNTRNPSITFQPLFKYACVPITRPLARTCNRRSSVVRRQSKKSRWGQNVRSFRHCLHLYLKTSITELME